MKILHCSDIHLGKRPFGSEIFSNKRYEDYYKAFNQLAEQAIENKVNVFMIAGDLFDKRDLSPDNLRRSEVIFEKLKNANIKVLLIEGNHDNTNKYEEINSWLHYLEEKNYAKRLTYEKDGEEYSFIPHKIDNINFYGLGYPGFNVDKVVEELAKSLNPLEKNIVLIHTAIGGGDSDSLPGLIKTESLKLLKDKVIYVAGGHYHSKSTYPKENPYFFIPGSPEYWNILNEKSDEKGAFIYDTETNIHSFMKVNQRKRLNLNYTINPKENFIDHFTSFVKSLNLTGEELVIIKIELNNNSYINSNELENILEEVGALKAYIIPIFKNSENSVENSTDNSTLYEIEKSVIDTWENFRTDSVTSYLQNLKEYQRDNDNTLFFETFDKMLEELLKDENQ